MDTVGFLEPLIAPTVPLALSNIPGGEENLLPIEAVQTDLKVTFPLWSASDPRPGHSETVSLNWDGKEVAKKTFTTPVPDDPSILFADVPRAELTEGPHQVGYRVSSSGNDNSSVPITVTIDKTPPVLAGSKDPLTFPGLVGNTVTARYLEDHDNKLPASVPAYFTPRPGDIIRWYWEKLPSGIELAGQKTLTQADMSLQIEIDGDLIVASGDGQRYATYEIQDRAGNVSMLSRAAVLTVDAQPVPLTLPSVKRSVPSSAGKGTLDPLLVTYGAVVVIPAEIDTQPGDLITVYWTGVNPGASHVTTTPGPDDLEYAIPASAVPGNIGAGREIEVYYTLTRLSGKVEESDKYLLTISPIPEAKFPLLKCLQAEDTGPQATLRLSKVPNGADFTITPWVFMMAGQKMRMWAEGVDKVTGGDLYLDLFIDREVAAGEVEAGIEAVLVRSFLEQLKLSAVFWVDFEVSFDGGLSYLGFRRQEFNLVG